VLKIETFIRIKYHAMSSVQVYMSKLVKLVRYFSFVEIFMYKMLYGRKFPVRRMF